MTTKKRKKRIVERVEQGCIGCTQHEDSPELDHLALFPNTLNTLLLVVLVSFLPCLIST